VSITRVRKIFLTSAVGTLAALAVPAAAPAQRDRALTRSPLLWATINICDSARSPDTVGVRASMPGSGRRGERMFMRFRLQLRDDTDGTWDEFSDPEGTTSRWVPVGSARVRSRRSGWSFPFELQEGQTYQLRGVVSFQWRKDGKVVRRATKRTRGGHGSSVGEPRGFSEATCVLEG
jgi:hypothetical protein